MKKTNSIMKKIVMVTLCILTSLLIGTGCVGGCLYLLLYYVEMTPEQKVEAEQAMEEAFARYQEILEKYSFQNYETREFYSIAPDYHPKHDAEVLNGLVECELPDGGHFRVCISVFFNEDQELTVEHHTLRIRNVASDISEFSVIGFEDAALTDELLKVFCNTSESLYPLLLQYRSEIIEKWENGEYEDRKTSASIKCRNFPDTVGVEVATTIGYHYEEEKYTMSFDVYDQNYR